MRRFNPLIVKIMSLLFLVLCFMIPVDMVRDLIRDRQFYQSQVEQELTQSTSGEQTIAAPTFSAMPESMLDLIGNSAHCLRQGITLAPYQMVWLIDEGVH